MINNSLLNQSNMVKALKEHQELMSNNLESKFNVNIMQTFQALNMMEDHKNMDNYQDNEENVAPKHETDQLILAMKGYRDPILEQLMQQMTAMQAQLGALTNKKTHTTKYTSKENVAPLDNINPKTGQLWKIYCWSCGCCPHWSKYCTNKKKGHKIEATFNNSMNRSNTNYLCFFEGQHKLEE